MSQRPHVPTGAEAHAGMLDPWEEIRRSFEAALPPIASSRSNSSAPARPGPERDEVVTSAPPVVSSPEPAWPGIAPAEPSRVSADKNREGSRWLESGAASEWPEAARQSLARTAHVQVLALDDEVFGFGLAMVLEGSVDVAATIVDAPAERLDAGSVLRGRGTLDGVTPLRLIACTNRARVATWREPQIVEAFHRCPSLDNQLRLAANRVQALVGVTLGPLGDRLDAALRSDITRRLTLRPIAENEVVVQGGEPIPGLVVVGTGEIELSARLGAPGRVVLRSGEFLFPSEVLRAAPAPSSVRGAKGGALVLTADRSMTQELLVTCPSLLEILAGT